MSTDNNKIIEFFKNDRFVMHNGIKIVKAEPGYAVAQVEINDNHLNAVDMVQGGVIFTLADFAFAVASNAKGLVTVSVNSTISYIKSSKGKVLTAEAKEVNSQKKLCTYNVDVFDENKDLIAKVTATGYIKNIPIDFDKESNT